MFWLLALLPLLAVVKVLADARGRRQLARVFSPASRTRAVDASSAWREWTVLGLEMAALVAFITALARPQLGFTEEEVTSSGRSLMLAIDTSRSMLAEDIKPNRLDRTKLVASELIKQLPGDKIGLIAFAGKAFVQAPVTQDHGALLETLDQFDTDLIPRGGSNLGEAIDLAVEAFTGYRPDGTQDENFLKSAKVVNQASQALLIFSDGEELEGEAFVAADRAANRGVMIISVGVGTAEGGVIPYQATQQDMFGRMVKGAPDYVKDDDGKIVRTQLVEKNLVAVANATRGLYVPLLNLIKDERLPLLMKKLEVGENQSKTIRRAVERYQIPLTLGILLLLAALAVKTLPRLKSLRSLSPAVVTLLVLFMAMQSNSMAAEEQSAPLKHDPQRYRAALTAFQKDAGASAVEHLGWQWLGEASVEFAKGQFDSAVAAYGKALASDERDLQTQAHFGLANTIYRQAAQLAKDLAPKPGKPGEKAEAPTQEQVLEDLESMITKLEDSLAHYINTLELKPDHAEAQYNKEVVEKLLSQLKEEKQKQEQKKEEGKEKKQDPQQGEGEGDSKQEKSEQEKDGEKKGEKDSAGKDGQKQSENGGKGEKSEGEEKPGEKSGDSEGEEQKDDKEGGKKPNESKDGKSEDQKEDGRTEAQKQKAEEAKEKANKERDGTIKAQNESKPKQGEQPKENAEAMGEQKKGFSPDQARRQAQRMSDEARVRQEIQQRRDRNFKNW